MYKRLSRYAQTALYLSRFLLTTVPAILALLAVWVAKPSRMPTRLALYLLACAGYVATILLLNPARAPISNTLFYFSFLPPFLVMLSARRPGSQEFLSFGFMLFVFIVTLADAVMLNSRLRPYMWFFAVGHVHEVSNVFGFYQRPSGVAGIASSSGAIAVFGLVLSDLWHRHETLINRRMLVTFLTLVVLESGMGFGLFSTYVVTRLVQLHRVRRRGLFGSVLVLAIVVGAIYAAQSAETEAANELRFSLKYMWLTFDYKLFEVKEATFGGLLTVLLGAQVVPGLDGTITTSDFALLGMVTATGVVGTLLVLSAPLVFPSSLRPLAVPTMFFYLCFLHYPALSSPPGAVLFGVYLYLLAKSRRHARRSARGGSAARTAVAGAPE
jgi:hypothetical protein